jgi:hypothetical protein
VYIEVNHIWLDLESRVREYGITSGIPVVKFANWKFVKEKLQSKGRFPQENHR